MPARGANSPARGRQGTVRSESAPAAIAAALDRQGSGGSGALGSEGRLQGWPAGRARSLRNPSQGRQLFRRKIWGAE